jgi:hypothetical protein
VAVHDDPKFIDFVRTVLAVEGHQLLICQKKKRVLQKYVVLYYGIKGYTADG